MPRTIVYPRAAKRAAAAGGSASAPDELSEKLLKYIPGEVIAFYVPGNGHCGINVVVWDRSDASGNSAARVRVSLNPRQTVHIDSAGSSALAWETGWIRRSRSSGWPTWRAGA